MDLYSNDPARRAGSMAHHAEILLPCLEGRGARSVMEVGAFAGDLTQVLVDWAARSGARVLAVDPSPLDALIQLDRERPELELIREPSLDVLRRVDMPDAVILDGDHNYYTLSEELRLIDERAEEWPLVLLHDVLWPHARRDDYFNENGIPADARHPVAGDGGGITPGVSGLDPGGLSYPRSAAQEGGPRNGVLTAVEDFLEGREDLRMAVVPVFFGLGVIWPREALWAEAVARILDPLDRNPLLERLEANRVHHIAKSQAHLAEVAKEQQRHARGDALLRRLLESSAFGLAERLSRLRVRAGVARGQRAVTREEVRRALER